MGAQVCGEDGRYGTCVCGVVDGGPVDAGGRTDAGRCTTAAECDDGVYCNGQETCESDGCATGTAVDCDDGDSCTSDACDEAMRMCTNEARDEDGDGHTDAACAGGDDCDDTDPLRYAGAEELCDDGGRDEDCDPATFGRTDADSDGYVSARCCNGTTCGNDCDDVRGGVHPGLPESCDRLDNDCDGTVDDGVAVDGFVDADRDGHGDPTMPLRACADTVGYSPLDDDCDDADASVHPGQVEICDMRDNDCDGMSDEGASFVVWYRDADADGYGSARSGTRVSCEPPAGYALLGTDCNDMDAMVSPMAAERCNALDDDCDGTAGYEIAPGDFEDDDRDGLADAACTPAGPDCDDENVASGGRSPEVCDGLDNDCNGAVDDGAMPIDWYRDADGDGYGAAGTTMRACAPPAGYASRSGDCADTDAMRSPAAFDTCNTIDDDCDTRIDETVNTMTDPLNCGSCGTVCPTGETCVAGTCGRPCTTAADCDDRDACSSESCTMGRCAYTRAADGTACGGGQCRAGACCTGCWDGTTCQPGTAATACGGAGTACAACDDARACTADACSPARACTNTVLGGNCLIAGSCYTDGAVNPSSTCQRCNAAMPTAWTELAEGAACTSGGGSAGLCRGAAGTRTCCTGCWNGFDCAAGTTAIECGRGGGLCGSCECTSDTCAAGACAPAQPVDRFTLALGRGSHTCAVTRSGQLWCWGDNAYGQLGLGDTMVHDAPVRVGASLWRRISASGGYGAGNEGSTCGVRTDGSMWCWGYGAVGTLGLGDTMNRSTPTRVGTGTGWTDVAHGLGHTLATEGTGNLWAWGENSLGSLGLGDTSNRTAPARVGTATNWTTLTAGYAWSGALRADGTLWTWGNNPYGGLGHGDMTPRSVPTQVRMPMASGWTDYSVGYYHGCALRGPLGRAELWCWGQNNNAQLGMPCCVDSATPMRIGSSGDWSRVGVGGAHSCGIRADGTLWCWGWGSDGQLGIGTRPGALDTPTQVGTDRTWAAVDGGYASTCGLHLDGRLYCWGANPSGQLGTGDRLERVVPTRVCIE